jgi:Ca2+-binding RTX toxin-like protein
LTHTVFNSLAQGPLPDSAFKDVGVAGATVDADDHIIYNSKTGALSYDADGSGPIQAVQFATLDNHAALAAHDLSVL